MSAQVIDLAAVRQGKQIVAPGAGSGKPCGPEAVERIHKSLRFALQKFEVGDFDAALALAGAAESCLARYLGESNPEP